MLKQILFSVVVATGVSVQKINAMECQKCISLQNALEASLSEQKKLLAMNINLAAENQKLMKEQIVLIQQHDTLVNLNTQLTQTLSHILRLHRVHKKNTTGIYFTNSAYSFLYPYDPSFNAGFKITHQQTE